MLRPIAGFKKMTVIEQSICVAELQQNLDRDGLLPSSESTQAQRAAQGKGLPPRKTQSFFPAARNTRTRFTGSAAAPTGCGIASPAVTSIVKPLFGI